MTIADDVATRLLSEGRCPHCNRRGGGAEVARYSATVFRYIGGARQEVQVFWWLSYCPACQNVALGELVHGGKAEGGELTAIRYRYPAPLDVQGSLPPNIRREYESALDVREINPNAFAVLLGRVLQLVCQDRGAQGGTLFKQLENLAQRGEIPTRIAEIAHRLRRLRAIGAHADLGELSEDEIPIVADLCEAVLSYVYVLPALLTQADQKLRALPQNK